ncbi:BAG family molecular chaperone regulator [Aspergillus candidus]|uniref:BAG domain-containing protein n=1 Tax=Aspergillus candidus TaxID=41067 RepID=A0A2I2EXK3_ASPCN|nr:hypothetical protein BDW47DRAFT_114593 [Aspergillus candidus]PLB33104.1 hypothetical protein BDW47DRAFT_114593 [Aspergillus candidus]
MSLSSSSLGDKYALYLDSLAAHIRPRWQSVLNQVLTSSSSSLSTLDSYLLFLSESSSLTIPIIVTILLASILLIIIIIITMSWHSPLTNFLRRTPNTNNTPYTTVPHNPPYISPDDYSYISPDEAGTRYERTRYAADSASDDDGDNQPDTLLLKHRKNTYELHFPAYAISDGTLTVGQLRKRAAEVTRTRDPNRIVLLYKGEILHKDAVPCCAEGLKQDSEVLCVVSEVEMGEGTPSGSDVDVAVGGSKTAGGVANDGAEQQQQQQQQQTRTRNRNRNKNKKKLAKKDKEKGKKDTTTVPTEPARPAPTTTTGSSTMPPPSPNLKNYPTARDQVEALRDYLRRELVPPCEAYARSPPTEEKARVFENRKLSETILAQVILKADGIEPSGDAETRTARKALINEAQAALGLLDRVG